VVKCGKNNYTLAHQKISRMSGFIGEFHVRFDAKGRFLIPAGLKKQIPVKEQKHLLFIGGSKNILSYTRKRSG
jgi:MraZ protein